MEKVTMRDWKAKASQYIRRMKDGEIFIVNGVEIGCMKDIGNVDHNDVDHVDHIEKTATLIPVKNDNFQLLQGMINNIEAPVIPATEVFEFKEPEVDPSERLVLVDRHLAGDESAFPGDEFVEMPVWKVKKNKLKFKEIGDE